ncbi:uncharacterized protein TOT_030000530 [Theileria orientalis strain Shintoku]|uniref:Lipoyl-binding domain-containing protein n=1 Tax=Theileria orientalis strain Shintoku TaxID=869250 RepID=J4CDJ8_THEOR|nr:uncharacterized protein TOT_030000530 [Theileria orientalis strain Shintoku]BAM41267.1 uncharacterized protein TOT_030000530 [Theileria orientalis strain Shintoku]|eukprot:XP_009691568.1 uncharacterized protein TOT_030000530 [Theileria orientalis strain Shintoku]
MALFSRARLALDSRLLSAAALTRAYASISFQKTAGCCNFDRLARNQVRKFSSEEGAGRAEMSLARVMSKMSSTLESESVNVVKVPNMGKNVDKCKIFKWVKRPGDYVNVDDLICIIETDLVFGKVYSRLAGTMIESVNQEGSMVSVGSDLAVLVNNQMLGPGSEDCEASRLGVEQKRAFSTAKYVPSISFSRCKLGGNAPARGSGALASGSPDGVAVLDDFYKSPYRSWFRSISEEEIATVNQGTVDVK